MAEKSGFVKRILKKRLIFPASAGESAHAVHSDLSCRQRDDLSEIVGLDVYVVRGLITAQLSALLAFMDDDVSLLGIGKRRYRFQSAAAIAGTIAGIDVQMERPQTERAMIP